MAYAKITADRTNIVIVVINLDPHGTHEDAVELPLGDFGLGPNASYSLEEAFTRQAVACRGAYQLFHLDPEINPTMLFRLLPADPV